MHSYLRSIGFSTITSKKQMDQILKSVIEDYDDKMVIECENNRLFGEMSKSFDMTAG